MCGITGFIDKGAVHEPAVIEQMTHTLSHRGPDGFGTETFLNPPFQLCLGHRRLSIIELSELGKQPMSWNQFSVVFNGEIYNHEEIKADLCNLGHQFSSNSDTEVLLHAYAQWGVNCLSRFIGMFAFALFDNSNQEIFIARDRTGIKPFFYYLEGDVFLFASELKAFHKHPSFKKKLSIPAVHAFLQYGSVPTPHCIFQHCHKLKPGHYIHSTLSSWDFSEKQYWNVYDYYNKPKLQLSAKEAIEETEKILSSAFTYRTVSDVPIGVFLSGGYDSACVTALLQKDRTEALNTFTVSVPDIGLDESTFANQTASILGTNHHEISCTEREAIEIIPTLPYFYDEPFADSSAIPTILVSKAAKKQVTVALSADGGDEVFAGYNRYEMLLKYNQKISKIPSFARKTISGLMSSIPATAIPYYRSTYNFAHRYEKTKSLLSNYSDENIMRVLSELFTQQQLRKLCKNEVNALQTYFNSNELSNYSLLAYAQAIDYQTYLLDDILQKVDRASMSVGLESREPFLDHRIIEFVAQLPDEYKINNGVKKWLLREIVHQYIPKEKMDRPKTGFAIPIENWLANELRDMVETHLSSDKVNATQLFNYEEIARLKTAFFSGRKEFGTKIWYLLSFMMWYEEWMN
jgi:asparagine synthase (glutamine-hydrolysing)